MAEGDGGHLQVRSGGFASCYAARAAIRDRGAKQLCTTIKRSEVLRTFDPLPHSPDSLCSWEVA